MQMDGGAGSSQVALQVLRALTIQLEVTVAATIAQMSGRQTVMRVLSVLSGLLSLMVILRLWGIRINGRLSNICYVPALESYDLLVNVFPVPPPQ